MKEHFKTMGLPISCSVFKEKVYQSRLRTSDFLSGAMTVGHYNQALQIHEVMFEVFKTVLFKRFFNQMLPNLIDEIHLIHLASEESDTILPEHMKCVKALRLKLDKYMQKVRDRYLGKLAQFLYFHQYHE